MYTTQLNCFAVQHCNAVCRALTISAETICGHGCPAGCMFAGLESESLPSNSDCLLKKFCLDLTTCATACSKCCREWIYGLQWQTGLGICYFAHCLRDMCAALPIVCPAKQSAPPWMERRHHACHIDVSTARSDHIMQLHDQHTIVGAGLIRVVGHCLLLGRTGPAVMCDELQLEDNLTTTI